jgi:hypothetical protein
MNQGFNMQDVMRMAMMQQGQGGQHRMPDGSMMANSAMGGQMGQGMMPSMGQGMGMMPNLPAGMTQEQYMEMMRQMQQRQMAMQMMQAGQPSTQQQPMPMGGLMNFMGK